MRLVGVRTVLTGIRSQTAKTIVRLALDVSDMVTKSHLASGFEFALSYLGEKVRAPRS